MNSIAVTSANIITKRRAGRKTSGNIRRLITIQQLKREKHMKFTFFGHSCVQVETERQYRGAHA
jgi:hypothetical protein